VERGKKSFLCAAEASSGLFGLFAADAYLARLDGCEGYSTAGDTFVVDERVPSNNREPFSNYTNTRCGSGFPFFVDIDDEALFRQTDF